MAPQTTMNPPIDGAASSFSLLTKIRKPHIRLHDPRDSRGPELARSSSLRKGPGAIHRRASVVTHQGPSNGDIDCQEQRGM